METRDFGRSALGVGVAAAMLSSCGRAGGSLAPPATGAENAAPHERTFHYVDKEQIKAPMPAGFLSSTSLVSSDLPIVAARIPDHSAPISVRHIGRLLEAHGARF